MAVEYNRKGALASHIRDSWASIAPARHDVGRIDRCFPTGIGATWTRPDGGFFVWMRLSSQKSTRQTWPSDYVHRVWNIYPEIVCLAQRPQLPGTYLRLAYSLLDTTKIEEAVRRLGEAVSAAL